MWVRILGSAAGGGFPQWNCNCPNCRAVRDGSLSCQSRTQSSIAISGDRQNWFLLNASPDIRSQIEAFPSLWPQGEVRQTPIRGVLLSDAELDHTLGLLLLREAHSLRIYTTAWVYTALTEGNPILRTLKAYCQVDWQRVCLGEAMPLCGADGEDYGLCCEAFATFSTKTVAYTTEPTAQPEATIGYRITDARTGHVLVYAPAVQELNATVRAQLNDCAVLLFDGTCWDDDELLCLGINGKTARAMGHLPVGGAGGSLEQLAAMDIGRKIYIHLNNTNPLLVENSPQRRVVERHGIEIAVDGMEMEV